MLKALNILVKTSILTVKNNFIGNFLIKTINSAGKSIKFAGHKEKFCWSENNFSHQ